MIGQLILITLFGTSSAFDRLQTLNVTCSVDVNLTFPDNTNEVPTVTCYAICPDAHPSWFKQRIYYHDAELKNDYDMMVKVDFNKDGDVKCNVVQSASDNIIKEKEKELEEKCSLSFQSKIGVTEAPEESQGGVTRNSDTSKDFAVHTTEVPKEGEYHTRPPSEEELTTEKEVTTPEELTTPEEPVTPVAVQSQRNCEEGYQYIEELDNCFSFSNYTAQWSDAGCACAGDRAILAILNSPKKKEAIAKHVLDNSWIGLSDRLDKGDFAWKDGSSLVYTNWAEGKPNYHDEKDCVEISADHDFFWNDEDCSAQRHFICEAVDGETVENVADCENDFI